MNELVYPCVNVSLDGESSLLSPDLFEKRKQLERELKEITFHVNERVDYIVLKLVKLFGLEEKFSFHSYSNQNSYKDGSFDFDLFQEKISVYIEFKDGTNIPMIALIKEGKWDFKANCGFPTRFLFEDFENEVYAGIEIYNETERGSTQKIVLEKRKPILDSIFKKLTPEEIKVLKQHFYSTEEKTAM